MGTPKNPEIYDQVTLYGEDGVGKLFIVVYVDGETVVCDSGARLAHFSRDGFAKLFEPNAMEAS